MSILKRTIAFAAVAGAIVFSVQAFTLEPMSLTLATSGNGTVGTFRISNDGSERIAISISALTRSADESGKEINSPADQSVLVFPARLLIGPGESKSFKVQWRGQANLPHEQSYRIIAEQIPLSTGTASGSGIKILFRYIASLYFSPPGTQQRLELESCVGSTDEAGKPGFLIELKNKGTRHVIAQDPSLEIFYDGTSVLIPPEEASQFLQHNYLPALTRKVFIPHSSATPEKRYEARLRFTPEH